MLDTNFLDNDDSHPGHGVGAALAALGLSNRASRDPRTGLEVVRLDHFTDPMQKPTDKQTYASIEMNRAIQTLTL